MDPAQPWKTRAWSCLLWALLALAALQWGRYGAVLAGFPYQVEQREGATLRSAVALKQGLNPWSPDHLLQDINVHGILEPWLAAKLLGPAVDRLELHRALGLALLCCGAGLLFWALRAGTQDPLAAAAGALAWLGANTFFIGVAVRNDALAALLFLAPLALWRLRGRDWTLALAVALAAVAVLAKLYAPLGGMLVALGLWIEGRRRAGLAVALGLALGLAAVYLAMDRAFPLYWAGCWTSNTGAPISPDYMGVQTRAYLLKMGWPLLALALWRMRPALAAAPGRAAYGQALAVLALLSLWLGLNTGAYLQYYDQLLQPVLLLAAAQGPLAGWRRQLRRAGLALAAVLAVHSSSVNVMRRFVPGLRGAWGQAEANLARARLPLAPDLFTAALTRQGREIWDNGHSSSLPLSVSPALRQVYAVGLQRWRSR
ncbi:MAG TPA: hypothetical protein VNZ67_03820, partial [bacterium]|nr:hypothetical protein [bacterium]